MSSTITVDIGTTSTKLCLFDAHGAAVRSARATTPTRADAWGEVHDTDALLGVVGDFIASLGPEERGSVARIAVAGVGESGGLVRPDLTLASPVILWHDHRGRDRLVGLTPDQRDELRVITGLPVNANYALSKIAWALDRAERRGGAVWLNVAEYVAAVMTGERWAEPSLASRTMALELETATWSERACGMFGVAVEALPPLRAGSDGVPVTDGYATAHRLPATTRIHVVGHDHMVGGSGADLRPGELLNSTGTTEGLLLLSDRTVVDEHHRVARLANGIAPSGDSFTVFASIPTGGSAFAALRSLLGVEADDLGARIDDLAERYLAGSLDLAAAPLVVPHFRGSPPPEKNSAARGVIGGLTASSTADDIVLGCFLGMARQFAEVLELFGTVPERIKVIGPASGNPLWTHLKADLLGTPLSVSRAPEVVSRGAWAIASGAHAPWESCDPFDVVPDPDRHARLLTWRDATEARWQHLKDTPW